MADPRFGGEPADIRSVSFYICGPDLMRARATYEATNWAEGDRSWSHFVQKAVLAEAARREGLFNDARPFGGGEGPLKPGRPTLGVRLRAAELSGSAPAGSLGDAGLVAPDDQDDEQRRDVEGDRDQA